MTWQNSETELGAKLGASLTPRVSADIGQPRGEQNSGLIDIRSLYAATTAHAVRRAQAARVPPRTVAPVAAAPSTQHAEYLDVELDELEADDAVAYGLPRKRSRFGRATIVLLMVAVGAGVVEIAPIPQLAGAKAIVDTAAWRARTAIDVVAPRAIPAVEALAGSARSTLEARLGLSQPTQPLAPPVVGTQAPAVAPAVVVTPAPSTVAPTPGTASPAAVAVASALPVSVVAAPVEMKAHAAAPAMPAVHAMAPRPSRAHAKSPSPAQPQPAAKAAPAPAKEPVKALPAAPAAADSSATSLEDLIRKEVQAESKRGK
jgi:hypothetical protein